MSDLARVLGAGLMFVESFVAGNTPGFDQTVMDLHFYNYGERHGEDIRHQQAPSGAVYKLSALAVGKITGTIPVQVRYFKNRTGPVDCDLSATVNFPFTTEVVSPLGSVSVRNSTPNDKGEYDITADVTGTPNIFNPRVIMNDKFKQDYHVDRINYCSGDATARVITDTMRIGYAAAATAAECLATPDAVGINSEQQQGIRKIYEDGLVEDIRRMSPNAREVTVNWSQDTPSTTRPYNEKLKNISDSITKDNKDFTISADPVTNCQFERIDVETGPQP